MDFLNLLEATALDEGALGFEVGGKDFSELGANIGENVVGSQLEERLEGRKVCAHLNDVLKSLLGLILEILRALRKHVNSKKSGWDVSLSKEFGVIR